MFSRCDNDNYLQQDIKEETEEEKIDIENHFHLVISNCEVDQLSNWLDLHNIVCE